MFSFNSFLKSSVFSVIFSFNSSRFLFLSFFLDFPFGLFSFPFISSSLYSASITLLSSILVIFVDSSFSLFLMSKSITLVLNNRSCKPRWSSLDTTRNIMIASEILINIPRILLACRYTFLDVVNKKITPTPFNKTSLTISDLRIDFLRN